MQLEIRNIEKLYTQKRGLSSTSFEVPTGELIAIVGHNGAGKSALLAMSDVSQKMPAVVAFVLAAMS